MRTDKLNLKVKKILGNGAKKVIIKCMRPVRNDFILFNVSNKAKKNKVNLNYWDESDNLGDLLSPLIVNHMLSLKGIDSYTRVDSTKHLYAVGSILTAGIQDATVWGSGVLNSQLTYRLGHRKLDVRSVRGPITRMILLDYGYDCPEKFGDPALLLPEIYTPNNGIDSKETSKIGLVTHKDYILDGKMQISGIKKINICTRDYKSFIDQIVNCNKIISSSLHGIIIAESYGIPAILLKPQKDYLKYYDYYYSTGRYSFPIANSVEEAISMEPCDIPDLGELRKKLHDSFPYDIYNERKN